MNHDGQFSLLLSYFVSKRQIQWIQTVRSPLAELSFFILLQLPSMHQELTDGRLADELVVPSNTRVYSIAKVREKLHKVKFVS